MNTAVTVLNVRYDIVKYNKWDAASRVVIDGVGFVSLVTFACFTSENWAPTLAGFAVGTVVSIGGALVNWTTTNLKDSFFGRKK